MNLCPVFFPHPLPPLPATQSQWERGQGVRGSLRFTSGSQEYIPCLLSLFAL